MKTTMKIFGLIIAFATVLFVQSCKEDEELPAAPTVTAPASTSAVQVSDAISLTFTAEIPGGFKSASVTAEGGTATVTTPPAAGANTGSVVVTFTAGGTAGAGSVTLTVTDSNDKTGSATEAITVSLSAVPTIAGIPASATIVAGETLSVPNVVLTATDGFAASNAFTVTVDDEVINLSSLITGASPRTVTQGPHAEREFSCEVGEGSGAIRFESYALGWYVHDDAGDTVVVHTGSIPGFKATTGFLWDRRIGIGLLCNSDAGFLARALFQAGIDLARGRDPEPSLQAFQSQQQQADQQREAARALPRLPLATGAAYAGHYRDQGCWGDLDIQQHGDCFARHRRRRQDRRMRSRLPPLAVATLLLPAAAHAATYQVGPTRPNATLNALFAAADLGPGDVVEVDGNVIYGGNIVMPAANGGAAGNPVTLRGTRVNGQRPHLRGGTNTIESRLADHVVFEGFEVSGTGDTLDGTFRCVYHHSHDLLIRYEIQRLTYFTGVALNQGPSGWLEEPRGWRNW